MKRSAGTILVSFAITV